MAKIPFKQLPKEFEEPVKIIITDMYPNSMVFKIKGDFRQFCTAIPKRKGWDDLQVGERLKVYVEKYMGGGTQSEIEFAKMHLLKRRPPKVSKPSQEIIEEPVKMDIAQEPILAESLDEVYKSLNKDQKAAYDAISAAYSDETNQSNLFFITGSPGTGKSYLSKAVMMFFKREAKSIVPMAPSHKAKKVLSEALGEPATTVARYCGYTMENTDNPAVNDEGEFVKSRDTEQCYVAIVDEVSMVSELNFDEIRESAKIVIALGDKDQLKAINEASSNLEDAVTLELTEQMRQDSTETALYRNIQEVKQMINGQTGFQYEFDDTFQISQNLVDDYLAGNVDVIIAYRNVFVDAYNAAIQTELTGDTSFKEGDTIIFNKPVSTNEGQIDKNGRASYPTIRNNGDTATIIRIHQTQPDVGLIVDVDVGRDIDQTRLLLTRDQWAEREFVWNLWLGYWKQIMPWKKFKRFAVNISLPFAITAHKAQGSTYKNVGINIGDINACWKDDDKYRMLYVAMSRAKEKCVVKL